MTVRGNMVDTIWNSIIVVLICISCQSCVNVNKNHSGSSATTELELSDSLQSFYFGNQEWMGCNLSSEVFQNGDSLLFLDYAEWQNHLNDTTPLGCKYFYENESHDMVCAYLYNWYAVMDNRLIAPKGYRIATIKDYEKLFENIKKKYGNLNVLTLRTSEDSVHCKYVFPFFDESAECKVIRSIKRREKIYSFWTHSTDHVQLQVVYMENGHLETGDPCNMFISMDEMPPSIAMSAKCIRDTNIVETSGK